MVKKKITRRRRYFARRGGGPRKPTISLAVIAGLMPPVNDAWQAYRGASSGGVTAGLRSMGNALTRDFTGWDVQAGSWNWQNLKNGLVPVGMGVLAHRLIGGTLGVNRMLARAGIPWIRL